MNPRLVVAVVVVAVCIYMFTCLGHSRISDIVLEGHQSVPLVQFQVSAGQMVRLPTGWREKTCQVRTATGGARGTRTKRTGTQKCFDWN